MRPPASLDLAQSLCVPKGIGMEAGPGIQNLNADQPAVAVEVQHKHAVCLDGIDRNAHVHPADTYLVGKVDVRGVRFGVVSDSHPFIVASPVPELDACPALTLSR